MLFSSSWTEIYRTPSMERYARVKEALDTNKIPYKSKVKNDARLAVPFGTQQTGLTVPVEKLYTNVYHVYVKKDMAEFAQHLLKGINHQTTHEY